MLGPRTVLIGFTPLLVALLLISTALPATCRAGAWWESAVFYEIYPRSFRDSNGDGVGDLNGITEKLAYLEELGVDAIWIAPMYPSPQIDFGYDVSDYEAVDPQYGTLADMDRLIAEATRHHLRVVLDMIPNHTSDQHKWFVESASSRSSPKHDWYVWSDGVPGEGAKSHEGRLPPNNWVSWFGGSAWEWVPAVHQYYYHAFTKQQPDLNWRNPAVETAVFNTMRFWLDRGVAGFRLDSIPALFEDKQLRNARELGGTTVQGDPKLDDSLINNLPEVHGVIRRLRAMVDRYPNQRVLIGETYLPNLNDLDSWYGGARRDELHLAMDMLFGFHGATDAVSADKFRDHLLNVETELHGSPPLLVFDNHDNSRSADRYGDGRNDAAINRILASLLLTPKAAALMYYGEEIGMRTSTPKSRDQVKDPIGITGWPREKGRDGERTPMQWSAGPQSSFSTNPKTWLPIPDSYERINVAAETQDSNSLLLWYRRLLALRRSNLSLKDGVFAPLGSGNVDILAFTRSSPKKAPVLVVLNLSATSQKISLSDLKQKLGSQQLSTLLTDDPALVAAGSPSDVVLAPYATWIASVR